MKRRLLSAILLLALAPTGSFAACTSPVGNEGETIYNADYAVMQFCDGVNWVSMAASGTVTEADPQVGSLTGDAWCRANAGGTAIDCTTASLPVGAAGSDGYIQFNSSGSLAGDSAFYWDNTNKRLGIGTANPATALDVSGTVTATTFSGSGASLTNLNASNLASGTVATARLGSGTADSTTYLRGDGTWATVSASGGASFSCPSGFTKLENLGQVLGCVKDTVEGSGTCQVAITDCWNTYGARLPTYPELRIGVASGAVSIASNEWTGEASFSSTRLCGLMMTSLEPSGGTNASSYSYRCFIPSGANGSGGSSAAAGSNTQVQYNDNGSMGGDSGFVYSGGNVGIGTTGPTSKLHVVGDIYASGNVTCGGSCGTGGGGTPAGSSGQLQYNNAGAFGGTAALTYATSGSLLTVTAQSATDKPLIVKGAASQSGNLMEFQNSSGTALTTVDSAGALSIGSTLDVTGATTISSTLAVTGQATFSGNVGVGTATPAESIETTGNIKAVVHKVVGQTGLAAPSGMAGSTVGTLTPDYFCRANSGGTQIDCTTAAINATTQITGAGTAGYVQFSSGTALSSDSALYWDNTNKRLGIGTTAPNFPLQVRYSANNNLAITGPIGLSSGTTLVSVNDSGSNAQPLEIRGTTTVMGLLGNVGIGTTSPEGKLHIATGSVPFVLTETDQTGAGSLWRVPLDGKVLRFDASQDGATFSPYVTPLAMTASGNVGIGTTSPSYKLHVNGTAYATGAAGALSDIRHKRDVATLKDGALEIVGRLRPVSFYWKEPGDDGMKGEQLGFIAQEVEKVLPQVVLTQPDKEHTKGLKPTEIIPVLTKAIQELKSANDNLRSELKSANDNQAAEIKALKEEIARMKTGAVKGKEVMP